MSDQPFITPAILIMLFSLPLCLKLIPRNRYYGIRTAITLLDDAAWYKINQFGGFGMVASGSIYLCTAIFVPYAKHGDNFATWLVHLFAFAGPLLITLVVTNSYSKRLQHTLKPRP